MTTVTVSTKGQIALPKDIREHYHVKKGKKFAVQETPNGIMLVPIPEKPLLALIGLGKGLKISSRDVIEKRKKDEEIWQKKWKEY